MVIDKTQTYRGYRWVEAGIIFLGWTLFGLFFAAQRYAERAYAGRPTSWIKVLTAWAVCAYLWAVLTPLVLHLARRFPFGRSYWFRPLLIHLVSGIVVSAVQLGLYLLALELLLANEEGRFASLVSFRYMFVAELHFNLLLYGAIVGISHFINHYREKRERELMAAQLEARLIQAQLDALRFQLRPHLLFNTLNSISVLIRKDADAARRTVEHLSDLLRVLLKHSASHEVTLREELDFLNNYLEIERTRFPDRLQIKWDVDPETLEAAVPSLILQPIVENAIKHGIAPRAEAGQVEIRAERFNGAIRLQVRDDGPGLSSANHTADGEQVGLSNTKARLERMYGASGRLELNNDPRGGTVVNILIPFHPSANPSQ